ncbi:MAG: pilus assembly protein [Novosphingobium sp.]|nr:pilus assembly protein [Novosphingobium sp.]MCP5403424.1 pilus assembly protein [Novosphingobium sp.]
MTRPRFLERLARCNDGVALVEFAYSLPLFLVLLFGGLEIANLAMTHLRINQIAINVADNAGRVRTGIDESNIYEVFAGADFIGRSIGFAENGRVVLSSLEPNGKSDSSAGQMINWQRCHGALQVAPRYGVQGTGRNNASLASGMGGRTRITAADGTAVMFVEVTFRYRPVIFSAFWRDAHDIRYESAFNVRERTNQVISNAQGLAVNSC